MSDTSTTTDGTGTASDGTSETTGAAGSPDAPADSTTAPETAPEAAGTTPALALTIGWVGGMRMNIEWDGGDWAALQEAITQNKFLEVVQGDGIPVLVNVEQLAVLFRRTND